MYLVDQYSIILIPLPSALSFVCIYVRRRPIGLGKQFFLFFPRREWQKGETRSETRTIFRWLSVLTVHLARFGNTIERDHPSAIPRTGGRQGRPIGSGEPAGLSPANPSQSSCTACLTCCQPANQVPARFSVVVRGPLRVAVVNIGLLLISRLVPATSNTHFTGWL